MMSSRRLRYPPTASRIRFVSPLPMVTHLQQLERGHLLPETLLASLHQAVPQQAAPLFLSAQLVSLAPPLTMPDNREALKWTLLYPTQRHQPSSVPPARTSSRTVPPRSLPIIPFLSRRMAQGSRISAAPQLDCLRSLSAQPLSPVSLLTMRSSELPAFSPSRSAKTHLQPSCALEISLFRRPTTPRLLE
jgi:hypothetical protein